MPSSVDDRIVSIQFDNRSFERNIAATLDSLEKLKKGLEFSNSGRALQDLGSAVDNVNFGGMSSAIDNINDKFSALGAVAFSVIQDLTQSAIQSAKTMAGLVLDPLEIGGKRRATNIENAKFQFRGLGIDVETAMASAKAAVLGTAFGLDEAARAAAQFGASGVNAGADMTTALRGIAGAAAMTNTSFSEIADIFTSVAGIGTLGNADLNRFAVRGLNAAATLAKQFGVTEEKVHEMARDGEISFAKFAKAMDNAFGAHSTKANETYTGALANMNAALSRLGASFFGPKMEQQRTLFNALTPVIDNVNAAMQPLIQAFLRIRQAGVDKLIGILKNLNFTPFKVVMADAAAALGNLHAAFTGLVTIIKDAFKTVFPNITPLGDIFTRIAAVILHVTANLRRFTEGGSESAHKLYVIFRGIFDALAIGLEVVKVIGGLFVDLFKTFNKTAGKGNLSVLNFFENLALNLTKLKIVLVNGGGIRQGIESFVENVHQLFLRLQKDVSEAVEKIERFFGVVKDIKADGINATSDSVGRLTERLGWLEIIAIGVGKAWDFLTDNLGNIQDAMGKVVGAIGGAFAGIGHAIAETMKTGNFDEVFDVINTGLIGGILFMIAKFMKGGLADFGGTFLDKVNDIFDKLTGTLEAMQLKLKADALMKIAAAIGVMAASLLLLSLIDSAALTKALTAMGVGTGILVGAMAALDKLGVGGVKLGLLAGAMIGLATAMLILSGAVKVLSTMSWGELAKGLTSVAVLLGTITLAMNLMPESGALVRTGIAIVGIAIGIRILANAVQAMATMSWGDMAKGLTGVAVALGLLTVAMNFMPNGAGMVLAGAGIVLVATGLNILAAAVKLFSMMKFTDMIEGLIGIGGAMLVIAGAMSLMPVTLPITAAGLVLVGIALNEIAVAMKIFGSMDLGEIAKGLGVMAGALVILAIATTAMQGTIGGAASILIAATALSILGKVIKTIGKMKWQDIVRGLAGIAGALAVLGIAAALITPTIPSLLALGVAMTLVGAGFALFGIGAAGVANALKLIADTGAVAIGALIEIFDAVILKLPELAVALAEGLIIIAGKLLEALPGMMESVGLIILAALTKINELIPQFAITIGLLVDTMLKLIVEKFPDFVQAGFDLLMQFLLGIGSNIAMVTDTVVNIILTFLAALTARIAEIVAAGLGLLTAFLRGIADNIQQVIDAGFDIIVKIIEGINKGTQDVIEAGTKLITDLITGIGDAAQDIIDAGTDAMVSFLEGLVADTVKLANGIGDFIVAMLDALTAAIKKYAPQIQEAGKKLAGALLDGMTFGIAGKIGGVVDAVKGGVGGAIKGVGKVLGIGGPSRVFCDFGQKMMIGMANGIEDEQASLARTASKATDNVVVAMHKSLRRLSDGMEGVTDFSPVITPVLDLTRVNKELASITNGSTSVNMDIAAKIKQRADEIAASMQTPSNTVGGQRGGKTSASVLWGDPNWIDPTDERDQIDALARNQILFQQTINSPVALSTGEIYRNTRTQFAMAKEELKVS